MEETPKTLHVVVGYTKIKDSILFLERIKGDYIGYYAIPGGKLENNESIQEAVKRELKEETNMEVAFTNYYGVVSEKILENNKLQQHFILHICQLQALTEDFQSQKEGKIHLVQEENLSNYKEKIVPSDYLFINQIINKNIKGYRECIINKNGSNYEVQYFEKLG